MKRAGIFLNKGFWSVLLILLCLMAGGILLYTGIVRPNFLFASNDRLQGIDISNHQKNIDWEKVAQTGRYSFAFIKATEGETYRDAYFSANWRETKKQGILRGAYHFYTASLPGATQADNYIGMVPREAGMLPPVLDLEVSGKDRKVMLHEIRVFLDRLEQHYNMKPIIYTDHNRYKEYIKGNFENYPIWVGALLPPTQKSNPANWTFWQYSDHGHVDGIAAEGVDLDIFYGNREELYELTRQSVP